MAKPPRLPTWATDATYPAGAEPEAGEDNKVEPSATKKGIGWRPDEKPPAEFFNDWMNLVYLWMVYLDGNAFAGDVVIEGSLQVDEDLHVIDDALFDDFVEVGGSLKVAIDATIDGRWYHASDRVHVQGFTGGISNGTALSFHATNGTVDIAAGDSVMIPCIAPLVGEISRIVAMSILFENNTVPSLSLLTKTAPTTFVEVGPVLGVTVSDVAIGGGHTRRTITITSPSVLDANDRVFFKVTNNAISTLVAHELITTHDAPAP